ncbi:MAG: hypothetical protein IPK19_33270 [Chloroflexi bacterium]|nr:hypothetical protein [Chloroflexota bacterium]
MSDKKALKESSAGMRLIALVTIFNGQDVARLERYIADSFSVELLASIDSQARADGLRTLRSEIGKLQVRQVIGASKENVIVLLRSEFGNDLLVDLRVGEEYPHTILDISITSLNLPQ